MRKKYMAYLGIKKSVTPRKKWLKSGLPETIRTSDKPGLGVLKNSQNPIKTSNFRTFLGVLSNIFRLNRLFSFVFSANFRFQNNFQTKIIPKTIPIFIAVFKKFKAKQHSFFSCYDTKWNQIYQAKLHIKLLVDIRKKL